MDNFTPVSALGGGVLIGLAAVWLLAANGRIAGVSGILHGAIWGDRRWRVAFILGLIAAGFAWNAFSSQETARISYPVAIFAGLLVGAGTQLGSGCTSGHGVCGIARFSLRSLVAVVVFMACGMASTFVMRHVL
jgi:uncharacterized membrane protein YedE/YeeE